MSPVVVTLLTLVLVLPVQYCQVVEAVDVEVLV
jgi:hypothetical protein